MADWYALKSRDELMTAGFLREVGYPAYVPCEIVERMVCRKKTPITRPLIPGYVFVCCEPGSFTAVRGIGASEDFVRCTDPSGARIPLRLAPNDLVPLILAEIFGEFDHTREPPQWAPKRGDPVTITKGLWKGYIGTIISVGRKNLVQLRGWKKEFFTDDLQLVA